MALSPELRRFCANWKRKAGDYPGDIHGLFDKFFTLFVVFNRLYAEATFRLARRGSVRLRDRFPDSQASQEYVVQYLGARQLVAAWESDPPTAVAFQELADHIRHGRFFLKLHLITGDRQPAVDRELLRRLESAGRNTKAQAGLEVLYAIRCNMFHGHKGFEPIQRQLLRPAIVLLSCTIEVLQSALDNDHNA